MRRCEVSEDSSWRWWDEDFESSPSDQACAGDRCTSWAWERGRVYQVDGNRERIAWVKA